MEAMVLHDKHKGWLEARGISVELAEKMGLDTKQEDGVAWLRVPYTRQGTTLNHKYRLVSEKRHKMDAGATLSLWNEDCLREQSDRPLVICEGEWDALTAVQLGWRAVSVPNGSPGKSTSDPGSAKRYEYMWEARDHLLKIKRIILATDGDDAGKALRADLIALLGPARCSFVEYPADTKDLNEVLNVYGAEAVAECLNNAKPVPVAGLHKLSAFPDAPDLPMHDIGIPGIDGNFGLVPGTFSLITGYAGHGKSSLLMKMIANLIAHGKNVTIGSFETIVKPVLERKLLACMCEVADHDPSMWKNYQAREILERRLSVIANTPDEDHELDLDALMELFEAAVAQHEADLIVVDPYNEVEHKRGRDETETEYAGRFIRTIKRFCHRTGVPVWLVAHPRKPSTDGNPRPPSLYDLHGSANFANKADYGIVVHRPDFMTNDIDVAVTKVRMGLPGRVSHATLRFDAARSRYNWAQGEEA
jgi:twinkle protein